MNFTGVIDFTVHRSEKYLWLEVRAEPRRGTI
jgi:hypothetical protein